MPPCQQPLCVRVGAQCLLECLNWKITRYIILYFKCQVKHWASHFVCISVCA